VRAGGKPNRSRLCAGYPREFFASGQVALAIVIALVLLAMRRAGTAAAQHRR
jgi:hypothetical protein